jgi:hypothetical protein
MDLLESEHEGYPYYLQPVQGLSLQDFPVRVMFCQWFLQQCGTNPNFPAFVIQNLKMKRSPQKMESTYDSSINICAGICGDHIDSHMHPNRLIRQNYKAFLENNMPDFLADVPLIIRQELHFMHDGTPTFQSQCLYGTKIESSLVSGLVEVYQFPGLHTYLISVH